MCFECLHYLQLTEVLAPSGDDCWASGCLEGHIVCQIKTLGFSHLFWVWTQWGIFTISQVHSMVTDKIFDKICSEWEQINRIKTKSVLDNTRNAQEFTHSEKKRKWEKWRVPNKCYYFHNLPSDKFVCWIFTLPSLNHQAVMGYNIHRKLLKISAYWQNHWEVCTAMRKGMGVFSSKCGARRGTELTERHKMIDVGLRDA